MHSKVGRYAWNDPIVRFSTPERITKEPSIDKTLLVFFMIIVLGLKLLKSTKKDQMQVKKQANLCE